MLKKPNKLNQKNLRLKPILQRTNQKKTLGNKGEQLIKKKLLNKGWHFISQNYHTRNGEIDLIFTDQNTLVFIEVKTRTNPDSGHPEEAITPNKLASIRHAANKFLLENPIYTDCSLRIDVAAIDYSDSKSPIHYYKNVY